MLIAKALIYGDFMDLKIKISQLNLLEAFIRVGFACVFILREVINLCVWKV